MSGNWEPFGSSRRHSEGAAAPDAPSPEGSAGAPPPAPLRREPARRLAIITCMDARIDPLRVLGLRIGDANVLRNAGATVSDDVLRSLEAARSALGVRRVVLMGHTDCAGHDSDAAAAAALGDGAGRVRAAMGDEFGVETCMYDVSSGAVTPV